MAGGALKYRHLDRKSSHRQALLRNLVTSLFEHESISTTWPKAKEAQRLAEKLITLGKKNTDKSRRTAQGIFYVSFERGWFFFVLSIYNNQPTPIFFHSGRNRADFEIEIYSQPPPTPSSQTPKPNPQKKQTPLEYVPKLFTTLRERYLHRPGGYTRVLRIEPRNRHHDQAPSAILELVDGPRDMRFALTAKTIVRERALDEPPSPSQPQAAHHHQQLAGVGLRDYTAKAIRKVTRFRPDGLEDLEREVARLERFQEAKKREEEKRELRKTKEERRQERRRQGREVQG